MVVSSAVASADAGVTVTCASVTVTATLSVGVAVTSLVLAVPLVGVIMGVDSTAVVMVADAVGVCVASPKVVLGTPEDAGNSVICGLAEALVTTPVTVTDAFAEGATDAVNGVISVTAPVAVGTFTCVMALPALSTEVTSSPVETVTDVAIVPDKADGTVKLAVPVRLLFVAVSSGVAAVIVTTAFAVGTGVAGGMATGVLSGSMPWSVVERVAAAVSTPEIASPTLPIAGAADVAVGKSVSVNGIVSVSTGLALTVGVGVASGDCATIIVPVTVLVTFTAVGKFPDGVSEILATLMPWAIVSGLVAVPGCAAVTSTVVLRALVAVNSPAVVTDAGVVDDTVWVNAMAGPESAAAEIAPLAVGACVAAKLVTTLTVGDPSAVGAVVV